MRPHAEFELHCDQARRTVSRCRIPHWNRRFHPHQLTPEESDLASVERLVFLWDAWPFPAVMVL
ncbi:hypothetical protein RW1_060_00480 [Rhodococcus wratislaviensis NBRC 100605]|uniref:Uncharacterized protein n=1 Tax=Rhodococcus wratislaviensis NBRC 100605 TaxID=1219028 RepID=X0PZ50_RHOWR|nr:hypothetical protein RW1_060_00480 [Rhodococcus wratislaviensis NBRC 100605]